MHSIKQLMSYPAQIKFLTAKMDQCTLYSEPKIVDQDKTINIVCETKISHWLSMGEDFTKA